MKASATFPTPRCLERSADPILLLSLDRVLAQALGAVFPCDLMVGGTTRLTILDVVCGSGTWALEVASHRPLVTVTGIDPSPDAITYARSQASLMGVRNATFAVMDAREALHFPAHHFDVIHTRLLLHVLPVEQWMPFLRDCLRVTRPGGMICVTEYERGSSSSPALEKLTALATFALRLGGYSSSPDGATIGLATRLRSFLRALGCQQFHASAHIMEYSHGTDLYEPMKALIAKARPLLEASLLELGLLLPVQAELLFQQVQQEIAAEEFCGSWPFLTVWGTTPR